MGGKTKSKESVQRKKSLRSYSLARAVWIVLAILLVGSFVLSVPIYIAQVQEVCPQEQPAPNCDSLQLDRAGAEALNESGLTLAAYSSIIAVARVVSEIICLLIALLIFWRSSRDRMAMLAATLLILANATLGQTFIWGQLHPGLRVLDMVINQLQALSVVAFFYLFPDWRLVPRWALPLLVLTGLIGVHVALLGLGLLDGTILDPAVTPAVEIVSGLIWISTLLLGVASQIFRYFRVSDLVQRQQTKWVVIGIVAMVLASFPASFSAGPFHPGSILNVLMVVLNILSFPLFAIALGIAIRRNRLWDIEVIVNRALIYGPLSAVLAAIFAASVALINQFTKETLGSGATTMAAVISALVVAGIFQPMKLRIERWINSRWYPDSADLKRDFIEFTPEVRSVIRLKDLLAVVARRIVGLLDVQHAAILLSDGGEIYRSMEAYPPSSRGIRQLAPDEAVLDQLKKGRSVTKDEQGGLYVPLFLRRMRDHDVLGILDIGQRLDGKGFSSDDKKALSKLGAEIGTSIYTAQLREKSV